MSSTGSTQRSFSYFRAVIVGAVGGEQRRQALFLRRHAQRSYSANVSKLEDLVPGAIADGIEAGGSVTIVSAAWHGVKWHP